MGALVVRAQLPNLLVLDLDSCTITASRKALSFHWSAFVRPNLAVWSPGGAALPLSVDHVPDITTLVMSGLRAQHIPPRDSKKDNYLALSSS